MLKRILLYISFVLLCSHLGFSQTRIVGAVYDQNDNSPLPGASVVIKKTTTGTSTDFNGNFIIEANTDFPIILEISFIGYNTIEYQVKNLSKPVLIQMSEDSKILTEVEVVADIAVDRKTPVAFTNVLQKKLEKELASQDMPMLLNSTPGVFATQSGGGDGDARITLRGFSQRNVAVMIDGVPVNDMENGWVYWSNWFGLDIVTRTIQVQRGLGASKLAIPSVGGTINIITKPTDSKRFIKLKQEIGSDGFSRSSIGFSSGKIGKGWGMNFATSIKRGNGWVDNTWTRGQFYYLKTAKQSNKHTTSITLFGAPQSHGQRSWKLPISSYDKDFATNLFEGSDALYQDMTIYNQAQNQFYNGTIDANSFNSLTSNLLVDSTSFYYHYHNSDFIDTTGIQSFGTTYNQHWGSLESYVVNPITLDTIQSKKEIINERENYYHKPQISIQDFWRINDKIYFSNIAYLSLGSGGGVRFSDSSPLLTSNGLVDFQNQYDLNTGIAFLGSPWGDLSIDPVFSTTLHKSTEYLYSSVNNHIWYGYLSTLNILQSEKISHDLGIDFRYYKGEHYREVYDLLGGDYLVDTENNNQISAMKYVGDIIGYHNDSKVYWAGSFYQFEYTTPRLSAFINLSGSLSRYKRIDYFLKKDLVLDDTTMYQEIGMADTVLHNGVLYNTFSSEAEYSSSDWEGFPSYTFKMGINYNLSERSNLFCNLGYLVKAPRFKNVFFYDNSLADNIESEKIKAFELGYSYRSRKFTINLNSYYTIWENKPVDNLIRVEAEDREFYSNINGMNAIHKGIEIDMAYKIHPRVNLEVISSIGDWRWNSANTVYFYDENNNLLLDSYGDPLLFEFDATGVHVGDAAQTQVGGSIQIKPLKKSYIKLRALHFGRYYSNFDPLSLSGSNSGMDSWQLPSYTLIDLFTGYTFSMEKLDIDFRLSFLNIFNIMYISDAQNNDPYIDPSYQDFDAKSAGVFFGLGRRINCSLTFTL